MSSALPQQRPVAEKPNAAAPQRKSSSEHPARKMRLGSVVTVSGGKTLIMLDQPPSDGPRPRSPQFGAVISVDVGQSAALGLVSEMTSPSPLDDEHGAPLRLIELELIG
ncbi:MAG: hypothetical protein AAF850_06405, partial [Pseudomonadota bacterium]